MNRRVTLAAAMVTVWALAMPALANHSTATGVNCTSFPFQEDAQAYFDAHPGDPEGLDGPPGAGFTGVPNVACENLPRRALTTTTTLAAPTKPSAILSGSSGQVVGDLSSQCWPEGGGIIVCGHVDYVGTGPDPERSLTVTQGDLVTLRYEPRLALATLQIAVWPGGPSHPALPAPVTNPSTFTVSLPPGRHIVATTATFHGVPQGTLGHIFEVVVTAKAPAPPTRDRRVALTG